MIKLEIEHIIIFSFIFIVWIILGISTLNNFLNSSETSKWKKCYEIVSIKTENSMSGSFILGSGTLSDKEYYYMMKKISKDEYKREKIESDKTIIQETDKKTPQALMEWHTRGLYPNIFNFGSPKYKVVVPENTVVKKMKIR